VITFDFTEKRAGRCSGAVRERRLCGGDAPERKVSIHSATGDREICDCVHPPRRGEAHRGCGWSIVPRWCKLHCKLLGSAASH